VQLAFRGFPPDRKFITRRYRDIEANPERVSYSLVLLVSFDDYPAAGNITAYFLKFFGVMTDQSFYFGSFFKSSKGQFERDIHKSLHGWHYSNLGRTMRV